MADNGRLTSKQYAAMRALMTAPTIAEAAEAAGVSERTMYRWLSDNTFRASLSEAETEAISESVRRLVTLQSKALRVLEDVLDSDDVRVSSKLRAASIVLDASIRLRELHTIEQRLNELEMRVAQQSN